MNLWARIEEGEVREFFTSEESPAGFPESWTWVQVGANLIGLANSDYIINETEDGVEPPSLDYLKKQIKNLVSDARWGKEVQSLNIDVEGTSYEIINTRAARATMLNAKFCFDNNLITTIKLKLGDLTFAEFNATQFDTIINEVISHTEKVFQAESNLYDLIDSKTTVEDLLSINLPDAYWDELSSL